MIETIMIEGKAVEIDSASGWTYCYREQFGHDILPDMLPIARSIAVAAEGLLRELPDDALENGKISGKNIKGILKNTDGYFLQDALDEITGLEIKEGFGQSETTCLIATTPWMKTKPGSSIRPRRSEAKPKRGSLCAPRG